MVPTTLCHFIKVEFYHKNDDLLSGKESACVYYTVPDITCSSSIDTSLGTKQTLAGDSGFQVLAILSDFHFMPPRMTYSRFPGVSDGGTLADSSQSVMCQELIQKL